MAEVTATRLEATPRHRLLLTVGVTLLLVAPANPQGGPRPQPEFPTLTAEAPAGSGMMQACLEQLEGRVRCGRYRVYENRVHAHPEPGTGV